MPEFSKWVNGGRFDGGRLSDEQNALREWYGKLIRVTQSRAFTHGQFYGLNHADKDNSAYGRLRDENGSGHWLYAFLRRDPKTSEAFLVVADFHPSETLHDVKIRIPEDARMFLVRAENDTWTFSDRLNSDWAGTSTRDSLENGGVPLPDLAPCSAMLIEIGR